MERLRRLRLRCCVALAVARKPYTTLFNAQTTDATSSAFANYGSPQGLAVLAVLDGASLRLEYKLPAGNPNVWVPVVNGGFEEDDLWPTEYSVSGTTANGIMKVISSIGGQYRLRLSDTGANTTVWAYVTGEAE